jgi:hypothetical protein
MRIVTTALAATSVAAAIGLSAPANAGPGFGQCMFNPVCAFLPSVDSDEALMDMPENSNITTYPVDGGGARMIVIGGGDEDR